MSLCNGFKLRELIDHCAQETMRADADMQLTQRDAWRSMNAGCSTLEGFDHAAFLGIASVSLSMHLEPAVPRWRKLLAWLRIRPFSAADWKRFRFRPSEKTAAGAIDLNITVGRKSDGTMETVTRPPLKELEGIHVDP